MRKFLKKSLAVAAIALAGSASAAVVTFEQPVSPFVFEGSPVDLGDYWLEAYSGLPSPGAFVGAIVDGSDLAANCTNGLLCPTNNASHFYTSLDDSYFFIGRQDEQNFKLVSFQASFMGFTGLTYPATSGLLILAGYSAAGTLLATSSQIAVAGPTSGQFSFATFGATEMGAAFANTEINYFRVLAYSCNAAGSCTRTANQANFAFDNFTDSITAVPEPSSWALMGLGLAGVIAAARRRRSV